MTLSSRILGYMPRSSQAWKSGDQSMKGIDSLNRTFFKMRSPVNAGCAGFPLEVQSRRSFAALPLPG